MGTLMSSWETLPPLSDFILPTPETYTILINIFQYFPTISLIQWLTSFHPAGKTSLRTSRLNLPGRWAWFAMEIIGPVNLMYILWAGSSSPYLPLPLPLQNKLLASLYVLHYINRAIISPLFSAPSMSPIHLSIVVSAMVFNWLNSVCLGGWLLGFHVLISQGQDQGQDQGAAAPTKIPTSPGYYSAVVPPIGLVLFFAGMACNIYSERILFRLRREEGERREKREKGFDSGSDSITASVDFNTNADANTNTNVNTNTKRPPNKYSKIYIIPPATGPFYSILYPHYVAEWIEWTGFALLGTAVIPTAFTSASSAILSPSSFSSSAGPGPGPGASAPLSPITVTLTTASTISSLPLHLAPWLLPAARLARRLNLPLPLPALVFLVNAVTNMLPHARWGRKWYVRRFGEERVGRRGAVVPFWGGC
ncbi:hypothetical protein BO70DRAFT_378811 [Aspergillus heteromorphus CBS 117.55]|uniref:Uncharacterized protein n=1 Tax=Aspergillus heteromorphus CBS 117.55 TaxID=1448321 RepID=A0A317WMB6_9EURO|nr:uncharacterized protein BO70DRAFT_378811 [Aspergillus heteromorphus CBS 117.55]PWY86168.1 hypothetical protein BO70DRAFT_378811 [Aspergillus heteromorphus CBS 117.55]